MTTAAVLAEVTLFRAVTVARRTEPASSGATAYVAAVAPAMSAQVVAVLSQRLHW